jgi:hypothetical protein
MYCSLVERANMAHELKIGMVKQSSRRLFGGYHR